MAALPLSVSAVCFLVATKTHLPSLAECCSENTEPLSVGILHQSVKGRLASIGLCLFIYVDQSSNKHLPVSYTQCYLTGRMNNMEVLTVDSAMAAQNVDSQDNIPNKAKTSSKNMDI